MPCTTYDPKLKIETNVSLIDDWRYMDNQERGHQLADALYGKFSADTLDSMIAHLIYRGESQTIVQHVMYRIQKQREYFELLKRMKEEK